MTYREFIRGIREQAQFIENLVKESQVINLGDEMGEADTIIMAYTDGVEEFLDNVTGVHGHTVEA